MTLIEVIDAARGLLSEPLDTGRTFPDNTSSYWTDSLLVTYFNLVQDEIQGEIVQAYEDYFVTATFLNIVNGTAEYSLPSGTIKVIRVEDARESSPLGINPVTINDKGQDVYHFQTSAVRGGGYYLRGEQIVFTSTPTFTNASAIRLYYVKRLVDVTAATAVSELPPEHHGVLVWGLVKYCLFQQQSDTTKADIEYDRRLTRLKKNIEVRQVQKSRRVKSVYGDVD